MNISDNFLNVETLNVFTEKHYFLRIISWEERSILKRCGYIYIIEATYNLYDIMSVINDLFKYRRTF